MSRSSPAPARWLGYQQVPKHAPLELYVLTADIPGHPVESTVTRSTLEAAGFEVPRRSAPASSPRGGRRGRVR